MNNCEHPETVLLKVDCGAGGIQYRRFCKTCWRSTTSALPHAKVKDELRGDDAPQADLDLIRKAQDAYWRGSAA